MYNQTMEHLDTNSQGTLSERDQEMTEIRTTPSSQQSIDNPEQNELIEQRKSVWLIDDNKEIAGSIGRAMRLLQEISFAHYQEGEQAINDFIAGCESKSKLPDIILQDYRLDERVENPKYRTGIEIIGEIKRLCQQYQVSEPTFIAFSSEQDNNDNMIQAGAKSSVIKSDISVLLGRLRELIS